MRWLFQIIGHPRAFQAGEFVFDNSNFKNYGQIPVVSVIRHRKTFMSKYTSVTQPCVLREMWRDLTGDSSAAGSSKDAAVDKRVITYFMGSDDPELLYDLHKNNGRIKDP